MKSTSRADGEQNQAAELRRRAEQRLREKSKSAEQLKEADVRALVHELQVHQIELEMQNEELLRAAAAADESSLRYAELFDFAPNGNFVWDEVGAIIEVNLAGAEILGLERSATINVRFGQFIVAEDRAKFAEFCRRIQAVDTKELCEVRLHKCGEIIDLLIEGIASRESEGDRRVCRAATFDFTQRNQSARALKAGEDRYRDVVEQQTELVCRFTPDLRLVFVNGAYAQCFGGSLEALLGQSLLQFVPKQEQPAVLSFFSSFTPNETIRTHEHSVVDRHGRVRWHQWTNRAFFDGQGRCIEFQGVARDITERKRTEESLRQQQRLLRIAGRVARIGGWSLDLATQQVTWSDEIREIHEEPIGHSPSLTDAIKYYAPEYRGSVALFMQECAANGTPFDFELELITAKGRRIWVRSIGEAVRDQEGRIVSLQGAFQDITDRKQAEAEQRRLAERLAKTLENITDGFFTLDREWRFLFVNAEAERMIDRRREDLVGISLWDAFPETIGISFEREYRRAIEQNVTVDFEEYFPPLDKWFGVRAYPSDQGLAVYFRDVTKSHNAEQAVRESEERFRLLAKATNDAIWDWDLTTDELWWNEGFETLFGYRRDEVEPTIQSWLNRIHPADKNAVVADVHRAIRSDEMSWTGEYRFVCKDGSSAFVLDRGYIIRDPDGKAVRMIGGMTDLTERKRTEESLLLRDRAIQAVSQGILITDPSQEDNPVVFASSGFERMTGYRSDEVIGKNCRFLQGKDTDAETIRELRSLIAESRSCSVEILNYRKDGTPFWNQLAITPVLGQAGQLTHFVGVQTDITERRRLEEQYRQAHKMEAVGRLAGGVAHDFNNLLTVIFGNCELLLALPDMDNEVRNSIKEINEAGERAASLTQQLLGFSRKSMLRPKVLDLNDVVTEAGKLLRRLIGEDILFTMVLDPKLSRVKVDPGQLDQVLMNLAVNARDAMPQGGKLTVETSNVQLSYDYVATHLDCKSGPHVMLSMSDTGCGMTPEVAARIFEPFYTTKEVGRGTGLGLAMVFGIVQQSGGVIRVYSEPGRGTAFKIYLPAVNEQVSVEEGSDSQAALCGTETILLVEDEEGVRRLAAMSLRMHGYHVLTATEGEDALRVLNSHSGPLDLILTDVVMPNVGGPELVRQLKAGFPGVKVLFMSGYTDDAVVRHGLIETDMAFIQKPYTPLGLSRKVRQVLDEKSGKGR